MIKLSIKDKLELDKKKDYEGILSLRQNDDGSVTLIMEDNDKIVWSIAGLKTDGTLIRYECLPDDIGLQVDDDDGEKIIESEE